MSQPYTFIANLASLVPSIPADTIVSRTVYSDEQSKTILFAFAAGQELSEHLRLRKEKLTYSSEIIRAKEEIRCQQLRTRPPSAVSSTQ